MAASSQDRTSMEISPCRAGKLKTPEKPKAPSVAGGAFGCRNKNYASGTVTATANGPRAVGRKPNRKSVMFQHSALEMPDATAGVN
jgi:hypothetical protein